MSAEKNFQEFIKRVGINEADLTELCDKKKHCGFGKNNLIACPWISLWCEKQKHKDEVEGIFMMQDWWKKENDDVTLESQVKYLNECLKGDADDQTLKNFLNSEHQWKNLVGSGKWLVTNAVWTLRPPNAKAAGYLGDPIHRKAFLVWSKVVLHFVTSVNFKLVIAGEWGLFNKETTSYLIKDYLKEWLNWLNQIPADKAELQKKIEEAKGTVQFCPHPFTWSFKPSDLIKGPNKCGK